MVKNFYFLFFTSVCLLYQAQAQTGTTDKPRHALPGCAYVEDPAIRAYTNEIIKGMYSGSKKSSNQRSQAILKIPVVVHVIEPSTSSSLITDPQINDFIANLNTAYRGTGYYSGSPDIEIEFELAKWGPDCAPTTGITRYDASGEALYISKGVFKDGVSWDDVQGWRTWNKSLYMNIWIVHKMDNGAAGMGGPSQGMINLASEIAGGHDYVTPHEVGHYLGVAHPFPTDAGTCDCGDGDGLTDTPNLMSYGIDSACEHESACTPTAQAAINPCTNSPFGQIQLNIMNYVNGGCDQKFTNDQRTLMREMLQTYHATLLTSPALETSAPTPTAGITGESTFCTSGSNFPTLAATCICSSVASITRNGNTISESSLRSKPVLSAGQSTTWDFVLTCANGTTATKSVNYYNPGVTNVATNCSSSSTYSVTFNNTGNYNVTASAGTISGNSVINIPNTSNLTLNVTDGNGCGGSIDVEVPCCAQSLVAASQCIPTATNGLSVYYGIENFTFGGINKSSSSSDDDENNYIDYSCREQASVHGLGTYFMSVKGYYINQHNVKVYIDYNNDGIFNDTPGPDNELVFSGVTPGNTGDNTLSANIVIPATAVKNTRLRIRVLADPSSSSNACSINGFATYGSGQIEDYSVTIISPLPASLISFEGKAEKAANKLKWSTSSESRNAGFEILRSEDAIHFESKGFIDKQTVVEKSDYQYSDMNINPGFNYYYRLKQIDNDKHFEMSRIIKVQSWYEGLEPFVSPNPVNSGQFTLSLPDIHSYSIEMYSIDGVKQSVNTIGTGKENELIITGKEKLRPGLYLLKMTSKSGLSEKSVKVSIQ